MDFPPKHPAFSLSHHLNYGSTLLNHLIKKSKCEKMNRREELFWADRERIRRAEEMRTKNENTY